MHLDITLPDAARRQGGAFTRAQALDEGWSRRQIITRLAAGHWTVVCGAGLAGTGTVTAATQAWSAYLTWPEAVVSHVTAAQLHRFPVVPCDVTHLTSLHLRQQLRGVRVHHVPFDTADVVATADGLRTTTVRRTAVDLMRWLPREEALSLFAWFATRGILTVPDLRAEVERHPRRWGNGALVRVARLSEGGALSRPERAMHRLLRRARLTGWTANAPIVLDGRTVAVADILFEKERVVVEVDGWSAHSDRESFHRDRRQQNLLLGAGYLVLRFTWDDLVNRLEEVVAQIRRALAARG